MSQTKDIELKRAALFIAKLLLRTREGRIRWEAAEPSLQLEQFTARLEEDIVATLTRDSKQLSFRLSALASVERTEGGLQSFKHGNEILTLDLCHPLGNEDIATLESIVYRDLEELIQLAKNQKTVSDDPRFKQAMNYLDRLAV